MIITGIVSTYFKLQIQKWKECNFLCLQLNLIFTLSFPFCLGAENPVITMLSILSSLLLEESLGLAVEMVGMMAYWGRGVLLSRVIVCLLSSEIYTIPSRIYWPASLLLFAHFHIFSRWHWYCVFLTCTYSCSRPWLSGHQAAPGADLWSVGRIVCGAPRPSSWIPVNMRLLGIIASQQNRKPAPFYSEAPKTDWWFPQHPLPTAGLGWGPGPREQGHCSFQRPPIGFIARTSPVPYSWHSNVFFSPCGIESDFPMGYLEQSTPEWVAQLIPWAMRGKY